VTYGIPSHRQKIFFFIFLIFFPSLCSSSIYIYADGGYAHVTGFSQTPKGGAMYTTSFERPTYTEAGINTDSFYALGAGYEKENYFIEVEYENLNPHGSKVLTQNLTTHDKYIPAKNGFNMNVEWNWYSLGFGRQFHVDHIWIITSAIYANFMQYQYHFSSPVASSKRAFNMGALTVGVKFEYLFTSTFSSDIEAKATLPVSNLNIQNYTLGFNYKITSPHFEFVPRVAIGFLLIDYEDNQLVPNHMKYRAFPQGILGFNVIFR